MSTPEDPNVDSLKLGEFSSEPLRQATDDILLGHIINGEIVTDKRFSIDVGSVNRNVLICGDADSGKSNSCTGILMKLWVEHRVPFLLIDTWKMAYRLVAAMDTRLNKHSYVYTLDPSTSPLQFNAFELLVYNHRCIAPYHLAMSFDPFFEVPTPDTQLESDHIIREHMAQRLSETSPVS